MVIKTKKYKLETGTYIKMAMINVLRKQWWVALIVLAIMSLTFIWGTVWFVVGALVALLLYLLFWAVQFTGVTQVEQNKVLFEKLYYEIDRTQILMKRNQREGMPVAWNMIKGAKKDKDAFILTLSKAQFILLPYAIFNSQNDVKLMESLLRRKNLLV